jgi:translation initiation factor 2 subunit 2
LIIKGRLGQRQIENILCSFISKILTFAQIIIQLFFSVEEYVSCKTCRSPDTLMKKEERLTVIKCNTCHSKYTVSNIRTGFQAQIGKRSKQT